MIQVRESWYEDIEFNLRSFFASSPANQAFHPFDKMVPCSRGGDWRSLLPTVSKPDCHGTVYRRTSRYRHCRPQPNIMLNSWDCDPSTTAHQLLSRISIRNDCVPPHFVKEEFLVSYCRWLRLKSFMRLLAYNLSASVFLFWPDVGSKREHFYQFRFSFNFAISVIWYLTLFDVIAFICRICM